MHRFLVLAHQLLIVTVQLSHPMHWDKGTKCLQQPQATLYIHSDTTNQHYERASLCPPYCPMSNFHRITKTTPQNKNKKRKNEKFYAHLFESKGLVIFFFLTFASNNNLLVFCLFCRFVQTQIGYLFSSILGPLSFRSI